MVASLSDWSVPDQANNDRRIAGSTLSPTDITLLKELHFLARQDRSILELRFRVGLTIQQIANLTGRSRSCVSRRISAVNHRLRDPFVQDLQRHAAEFDKDELDIALLHFAGGQAVDRIARDRRLSRHRVLSILAAVRGWQRHLHAKPAHAN